MKNLLALAVLGAIALGCAHKPLKTAAHLEIPSSCVKQWDFTNKTVCAAKDPTHALCSNTLVVYSCVKAVSNGSH
jgi:hypothetical protein